MANSRPFDFSTANDYRAGIMLARRFAPKLFTAANGYDLRKLRDINDLTPARRRKVREYTRLLRPLVVYGFKAKTIKDKKKLAREYGALYGIKELPAGLRKIPVPVDRDGAAYKYKHVEFETVDDDTGEIFARDIVKMRVSPGVEVARVYFDDAEMAALVSGGESARAMLAALWQSAAPDAAAIHAGQSVVKSQGAPFLHYTLAALERSVGRLQGRYNSDTANNYFANWMHGVDFYYFDKGNAAEKYLRDEQARYNKRARLAKQIKAVRRSVARYDKKEKDLIDSTKLLAKRASVKERIKLQSQRDKAIREIDKKRAQVNVKLGRLTRELYLTDEF